MKLPLAVALAAAAALLPTGGAAHSQAGPAYAVAARDLPRGAVLTAEDIAPAPAPPGRDSVGVGRPGWTTRRVIAAGEPLLAPAVAPPHLVEAGQTVQAYWRRGTIELSLAGRATGSAAMGERVLVRIDTRRRMHGVVVGPALVQLESPDRSR